ncbi:MAG: exodeoxyribonuclease III [Sedimentisphaerales bacterium]|jgi:exodeoxyribonuclease-3
MIVASFNVNSLRARMPIVPDWLNEKRPDVLCVQETKVQDKDFPAEVFDEAGYNYAFAGQKSYNGVAILAKSRIADVQAGFDNEPKDEPRLIKAEINGMIIVNTYIPQGYLPESEKFQYKLEWFRRLRRFFEEHFKPTDPVLWVGDLNIAPEAIDVYDPEGLLGNVCYHPAVHKELKNVMDWGFVDVFRLHCKEPGQYTFWDYRPINAVKRNLGWRLDHIMATKPLAEKCTACYIDKAPRLLPRPSDHTPIIAELDW